MTRMVRCLLIGVCGAASFCGRVPSQSAKASKPESVVSTATAIVFQDIIRQSRVKFMLKSSLSPQRYSIETMTGGVAVFDYDNDGLLDLFFTNGASIPSLEKTDASYSNRLFHNNGDGTFTDVTEKAGVAGKGYSMGVAAGDYDNDGFVDLYVTGVNYNQLLHNNGNGTFTDVTEKAGVTGVIPGKGKAWSVTAGWVDYNNDGYLDLFVVNYLDYNLKTAAQCSQHKITTFCSPDDFKGLPNILYKNNGDGTFTDVSVQSHIAQYVNKGMGVAFGDDAGTGLMDIFVSNDTFPNLLLHNNGDGTFTDDAMAAGVAYNDNGKTVAGMGADFRDLDDDGRPDIFHTAMFGDSFPLYRNLGNGQFEDDTNASGLTRYTSRNTAWGVGAYDFDNDGHKDLFTANAAILDNSEAIEHRPYKQPNSLYRNLGGMKFEDVSSTAGADFLTPEAHRGAAFGDLNNDGKIDIVVTTLNGPPQILMNRTENSNHWILLNLVGVKSNRDGLGTEVRLKTSHGVQYNQATTAVGYNSSSDKRVHFGLGSDSVVQEIDLRWPSGIRQTLRDVKADQIVTIREAIQ
jgi:hypothetical protein